MIERKKAQIFGPRTWCTKKPFGYQGYSLMSCPGQTYQDYHYHYIIKGSASEPFSSGGTLFQSSTFRGTPNFNFT